MITLLVIIAACIASLFCKNSVTVTITKELTASGWKPDETFTGLHVLINISQIVTAYHAVTGWFKKKEDKA